MLKHHHRFLVSHLIPIKLGEIDGETAVNKMFNSVFPAGIKA